MALGVPEIWRFDGEKIQLLALVDGQYQEIPTSIAIPIVTPDILNHWLTQARTMGESSWAIAVQSWAKEIAAGHHPKILA